MLTYDGSKEDCDSCHRIGHRLNSIMECQPPMQSPLHRPFIEHVHRRKCDSRHVVQCRKCLPLNPIAGTLVPNRYQCLPAHSRPAQFQRRWPNVCKCRGPEVDMIMDQSRMSAAMFCELQCIEQDRWKTMFSFSVSHNKIITARCYFLWWIDTGNMVYSNGQGLF